MASLLLLLEGLFRREHYLLMSQGCIRTDYQHHGTNSAPTGKSSIMITHPWTTYGTEHLEDYACNATSLWIEHDQQALPTWEMAEVCNWP